MPTEQQQQQQQEIEQLKVQVDPEIGWIFKSMIIPPDHTFFFCPYTSTARELFPLLAGATKTGTQGKLTIVTDNEYLTESTAELRSNNMANVYNGSSHHFLTKEKFHYAFCIPPYRYEKNLSTGHITANPVLANDSFLAFQCSKDSGSDDRTGPLHMMCLESMYNAVLPAGIFGAVLPKGWMGRKMRYVNWLQTNFSIIARLELPDKAVYYYDKKCSIEHRNHENDYCPGYCPKACPLNLERQSTHIKHELIIFGKPVTGNSESQIANLFKFALFRYQPFSFKLNGLDDLDIYELSSAFSGNEWEQYYIKLLAKTYSQHAGHFRLRLSPSLPPVTLDDPKNTVLFAPAEHARKQIKIVDSIDDIKAIPNAVHIKVNNRIKLQTYTPLAEALLFEFRVYDGKTTEEGAKHKWQFDEKLDIMMFHTERDKLAEILINAGTIPCLLRNDEVRLAKQEKWAERQLTPIERAVRVEVGKDKDGKEIIQWATQFEEIGMQSQYAALIDQWRGRMRKMKMHKLAFNFQGEDVLVMCCKNGVLNANVMGLGKTLQFLLVYLLRGNKKCLIVAPSKLLSEWTTEIKNRLASYCSVARQNWRGESIRNKAQYQIIEWAQDCLPENLKSINLISYEKLVRSPKDAIYYYCKRCGTTAASLKFAQTMPCQTCNAKRRRKWVQLCKEKGLKKYWVKREYARDDSDEAKACRFYLSGTGKNVSFKQQMHDRGYVCIDERPPLPDLVMMKRSRNVLIKKKKYIVSYEDKYVPVGDGLKKILVPVYGYKKRAPHLKWTMAHLLRHRFNIIGSDEADYTKNEKAQRSTAVTHLCAKTKIPATGTPVRGYAKSILNILNWMLRRNLFPEYRTLIRDDKGALGRFYTKYKTEVTNLETGKKKILPKIMNPEQFQTEIAPFMVRHTRNEPAVLACISEKIVKFNDEPPIPMDETHRRYYQLWLEKFSEWWQKMKEEEYGKAVPRGDVLVKLGYLINCSSQPHFMLENILKSKDDEAKEWARQIGKYRGPMTQKQLRCFELVKQISKVGDKALVFSIRRNNLKLGVKWCSKQNPPVQCLMIDGKVSRKINPGTGMSPRQALLQDFKDRDYSVLWAGLQCMRDGANLPEANHGIFMDLSWEPSDYRQASARMVRPQQEKTVYLTHLCHHGTIDWYVSMWTRLKARSVDEGVDYLEFDDFSTELIPDCNQYANAIVDGTEGKAKALMQLAIDHVRKLKEKGLTDETV